ncbi:MAG: hypothetical protein ABW178_05605 [Pseudoxanthomonas sp.]
MTITQQTNASEQTKTGFISWFLLLLMLLAGPSQATSSAAFHREHFDLGMGVGHDDQPIIASVNVSYLGTKGI